MVDRVRLLIPITTLLQAPAMRQVEFPLQLHLVVPISVSFRRYTKEVHEGIKHSTSRCAPWNNVHNNLRQCIAIQGEEEFN